MYIHCGSCVSGCCAGELHAFCVHVLSPGRSRSRRHSDRRHHRQSSRQFRRHGSADLRCHLKRKYDDPAGLPNQSFRRNSARYPSLTVTTVGAAAGTYSVTVTGTSTGSDNETVTLFLNIVSVPQDYTLTVSTPISPGTVSAGFGAQATVTVTPISSYTGMVTLSCLSITPPVTAAPFCSFKPATVDVNGSGTPTSVLTVSTFGLTQNQTKRTRPRIFYALWLAIPGLVLAGIGASGGRRRKLLGLLLLMVVASGLLLLPSCGSSKTPTTSNNANNLVTPKNTYTVTLTGVDQNGVSPSNITSTSAAATVSLTVN